MDKQRLPHQPRPCHNCPFRRDTPFRLGYQRALEITVTGSFVCHKTKDSATRMQCAGHMELMGDRNDFVRLANRLGIELKLSGRDLVFEDEVFFVEHHSEDYK